MRNIGYYQLNLRCKYFNLQNVLKNLWRVRLNPDR